MRPYLILVGSLIATVLLMLLSQSGRIRSIQARSEANEDLHVYVATDAGLEVSRFKNETLSRIGSVSLNVRDIALGQEGFIYLASETDGLVIFDVTDPSHPTVHRRHTVPGEAISIAASPSGKDIFVGWQKCPEEPFPDAICEGGIEVFLWSNPRNMPQKISSVDSDPPNSLVLHGQRLYYSFSDCGFPGCYGGIGIVDVGRPTDPEILSVKSDPRWHLAADLAVGETPGNPCGLFAFLAARGLPAICVDDPHNPKHKPDLFPEDMINGVHYANTALYVANADEGFHVLRLLPIVSIYFAGQESDTPHMPLEPLDVFVPEDSSVAFVISKGAGLAAYRWSEGPAPQHLLNEINTLSEPRAVVAVPVSPEPTTPPCENNASIPVIPTETVEPGELFVLVFGVVNTGTCTWKSDDDYHLRNIEEPLDAEPRQELPSDVGPGETAFFAMTMLAPESPRVYRTRWTLAQGSTPFGAEIVGQVTVREPCRDEATSSSPPRITVNPGERFMLGFRVMNTGTCTWRQQDGYSFRNVSNPLGAAPSFDLRDDIQPGELLEGTVTFVAPDTTGDHTSVWRMAKGNQAFGENTQFAIRVLPTSPPPAPRMVALIVPGYANSLPRSSIKAPIYPSVLTDLALHLEHRNVPTTACLYDWTQSNDESAKVVNECYQDLVQQYASIRLSVITWSNGGLVARAFIQGDNAPQVENLFMIAPPNYGAVDAYPAWAGGKTNHLQDATLKWGLNAVYTIGGCNPLQNGDEEEDCRYRFNRDHVPSLGQLVPAGGRRFIDPGEGDWLSGDDIHPVDQNNWLTVLNRDFGIIRQRVSARFVIIRGTGKNTARSVSLKASETGPFPRWRDGRFGAIGYSMLGDKLIEQDRASLLGTETLTTEADHTGLIGWTEREVIFPQLGLEPVALTAMSHNDDDTSAATQQEDLGMTVVAAGKQVVFVRDTRGRRAGRLAPGVVSSEIPGAAVYETEQAVYVYFETTPAAGSLELIVENHGSSSETVVTTLISNSTGDATWHHRTSLAPGTSERASIDPRQRSLQTIYVPALHRN